MDAAWTGVDAVSGGGGKGGPRPAAGHATRRFEVSSKTLVAICCVLGLLMVALNVKFIVDLGSEDTRKRLLPAEENPAPKGDLSSGRNSEGARTLDLFRTRLLAMLAATVALLAGAVYLLVWRFLRPVRQVTMGLRQVAEGNLDVVFPAAAGDAVGKLGIAATDVIVNYQEALLLTGTKVGRCLSSLARVEEIMDRNNPAESLPEAVQQIEVLSGELNHLSRMVKDFTFYGTRFDGVKVVHTAPE